ncbi:hypothetical protein B7P33_02025 [Sediminicola luteus]|uniref:Uncharacterized protein n=2 Tax=Sediminicola luteus TaxID=319238 RepID=A0A2A4GDQ2_9FLAO|nr:hypothetical protein B7P33_02025 [Sediminicola luteus]
MAAKPQTMKSLSRACLIWVGFFLAPLLTIHAQEDTPYHRMDGFWIRLTEDGRFTSLFYFKGDEILEIVNEDGEFKFFETTRDGLPTVKKSFQVGNNAVFIWSATCPEGACIWSETQSYHFSLLTDTEMQVHWNRKVNNKDAKDYGGIDCYGEGGRCFIQEREFVMHKYQEGYPIPALEGKDLKFRTSLKEWADEYITQKRP